MRSYWDLPGSAFHRVDITSIAMGRFLLVLILGLMERGGIREAIRNMFIFALRIWRPFLSERKLRGAGAWMGRL